MKKLLLLDLDGTVRRCKSNPTGFINSPKDQELIPGALDMIQKYHEHEWTIYGVTNQGGVAAGYKTLQSCIDEQLETLRLIPQMDEIIFCPDNGSKAVIVCINEGLDMYTITTKVAFGNFRKPHPGMINYILSVESMDYAKSSEILFVGDMESDKQCAEKANVHFKWADDWLTSI